MDPHSADSSLQKTSPNSNLAAITQLSSELSAQAHHLAMRQQQLNHLTSLTEEIVKALQNLHLTTTEATTALVTSPTDNMPNMLASVIPPLAFPEKIDGDSVYKPATNPVPQGFEQDFLRLFPANQKGVRLGHRCVER